MAFGFWLLALSLLPVACRRPAVAGCLLPFFFAAAIDSFSPAARSAVLVAMCAGRGIPASRPIQARSSSGSAMVNRPSRFTGIPAFAHRWTVDAGILRKPEIAAQPLSAPGAGCAGLRGFVFFAA